MFVNEKRLKIAFSRLQNDLFLAYNVQDLHVLENRSKSFGLKMQNLHNQGV